MVLLGFGFQVQRVSQAHVFKAIFGIPCVLLAGQVHERRQRDPRYFSSRCGPVNSVFIGKKVSAKMLHLVFERAHEIS